jgi:capsular polysaccharide biosynthesis protein
MTEQIDMPETVFERPTTLRAIRRYWYLVLICGVLAAACGAVYAFKRPPVYTANARMSAVSVNASNAAALAGSLEAAQELADTFARVVQSTQVTNAVASALHTTPAWVAAHVSGTPVPSSPFVMISANASTPGVATTAANAALKALSAYALKLIGTSSGNSSLLASIRRYSVALSRAEAAVGRLKGQAQNEARTQSLSQTTTSSQPTIDPALQRKIDDATAKVTEAQTQLAGAQGAYTQQAENQLSSRQAVAVSPASSATNDRRQVAQIAILLGLVIGVLIGLGAAVGLASRSGRPA